ncbi:oligopeptide transport ATP-binding protein OppD [Salmonella enterica subsp. enterica]|uniref:Oligopeptide transport ATP-binding protein OppD n=1 Tax=Salmonella enterica I TaxID=59201 RepID=A0A447N9G3_SALET|nr:oligopeptide transport ATP-binding protein OppD [Salmonella enterica subsp. enterica]
MEVLMLQGMSKAEAFEESVRMLDAGKKCRKRAKRMKMYPHEFSGGMRPTCDDCDGAVVQAENCLLPMSLPPRLMLPCRRRL